MSPMTIIRISRLMLLGRIALKAPEILTSLILDMATLKSGWSVEVMKDLKWLCLCPDLSGCNAFSFDQWFGFIRVHFKSFKKQVNKFARN